VGNLLKPALVTGNGLQISRLCGRVTFIPRLRASRENVKLFPALSAGREEVGHTVKTRVGGMILERKESS
jgi:hypothetical protein